MTGYRQTLRYLYSQLPMFHRIGAAAYKSDMTNTLALCHVLGNPHHNFTSIHVAGTNGKGSVSHMIASILQEAGLSVGLYTSPHLIDFRERIRINGEMIPKKFVTAFINRYHSDFETIRPSFFEMTVGMAFAFFKEQKVDMAVIETGLGGRLDSTNVLTPTVSVITNIGHDHQAFLGDTLTKIAAEKAGIIKHGIPVVIGETQVETTGVFIEKANEMDAPITFADQHFSLRKPLEYQTDNLLDRFDLWENDSLYIDGMESPLKGHYQVKNIATAVQTIDILSRMGIKISPACIRNGIRCVVDNTGLMGRWQILSRDPLTICDVGHNREGIQQVVNQIQALPYRKLHFIVGMVADREKSEILSLLPANATYYFCKASIPRALDQHVLALAAHESGLRGKAYSSVRKALASTRKCAHKEDIILVCGSTFVVAEVLNPR